MRWIAGALLGIFVGCSSSPKPDWRSTAPEVMPGTNEVVVLGMIHGGHRTEPRYDIDVVKRIVRAVKPDYILAEIPPERVAVAAEQFRTDGEITESRVRVFPEYTEAIFPLTKEMEFQIIGCAAWTKTMADERRVKLARWKIERKEDSDEVAAARRRMNKRIDGAGLGNDPRGIHTDRYDEIVKEGMEPYNRLFNDDLGAGGWDNINAAHYALIAAALDAHRGEGKRFLITFGAWHKHWFLAKLRERDDVVILPASRFVP